jgi:hypothetical protein
MAYPKQSHAETRRTQRILATTPWSPRLRVKLSGLKGFNRRRISLHRIHRFTAGSTVPTRIIAAPTIS